MINIRQGLFETNSSSMHTLTIVSESKYNAWIAGELLFDSEAEGLISKKDAIAEYAEDHYGVPPADDEALARFGYYTYEKYKERFCEFLDTYTERYVSESGDKIIVFGCYGYE